TEVGAFGFETEGDSGHLRVIESEYVVEILEPGGEKRVPAGEMGELVLTTLGRSACPLIRYRTGDLVRWDPAPVAADPRSGGGRLLGGILGRVDHMVIVRGNNVFPAAIESLIRQFPEVAEYRVVVVESQGLSDLRIELELESAAQKGGDEGVEDGWTRRVSDAIRDRLNFRADVRMVPPGSLPRFELKAKRWIFER
ncbi:MAG: phenylacetate--CoA ligase family protein, partial [Planctomycetota bacterium]